MASENYLVTRAGLSPDESGLPFTITTSDVERYLQRKVDVIVNGLNKTHQTNESVDVKVYTTEAGSKFTPFVVILPMNVLKSQQKKKKNENELDIFNPKEEDRTANLVDPFYNLFKAFIFNRDDEKAFFAEDWRRARGVARDTSPSLKALRTPKVNRMDNGKVQVVSFMIDPLRIFHDMLVMEDRPRDFKIEISEWKKIKTGEFRYIVNRLTHDKNKKRKYKDTFAEELNRKIRGGR